MKMQIYSPSRKIYIPLNYFAALAESKTLKFSHTKINISGHLRDFGKNDTKEFISLYCGEEFQKTIPAGISGEL